MHKILWLLKTALKKACGACAQIQTNCRLNMTELTRSNKWLVFFLKHVNSFISSGITYVNSRLIILGACLMWRKLTTNLMGFFVSNVSPWYQSIWVWYQVGVCVPTMSKWYLVNTVSQFSNYDHLHFFHVTLVAFTVYPLIRRQPPSSMKVGLEAKAITPPYSTPLVSFTGLWSL